MSGAGWLTSAELAAKTGTAERYVREWLNANAASGYVEYDPDTQSYQLPPEQAFALTVQDLAGAFHIISSCFKDEPKITQAFRTGEGVGWHEHDANLFFGTERFFRPNYANNLVNSWIPGAEGCCGETGGGRDCCGRRLRPRRLHNANGQSVSQITLLRLRLSQRLYRVCAPRGRA